jgi:hypothetical protein
MVFNNSSLFYVNVKFNLNLFTFHGHENIHVNLFFHIHVDFIVLAYRAWGCFAKWNAHQHGH